jgi:hypothetical protein
MDSSEACMNSELIVGLAVIFVVAMTAIGVRLWGCSALIVVLGVIVVLVICIKFVTDYPDAFPVVNQILDFMYGWAVEC